MTPQHGIARSALLAAAASAFLLCTPALATAQEYDNGYGASPPPNSGTYYDPCARSQANRSVIGGVLGAVAGATLGNSVTHGGAKLGGALIGGAVGAAGGAAIGHATAACQSGQTYAAQSDDDYAPPPPPPPGAYVPPDDDRYADRYDRDARGYAPPPSEGGDRCQMVEDQAFFPDGTTESSSVQACRDEHGRWHVVPD